MGAVVTGLIAAFIWLLGVGAYRWVRRDLAFGKLAGDYTVTRKLSHTPEPESLSITVDGNVLKVEFEDVPDDGTVKGEIAMSDEFRTSGRGHYSHLEGEKKMWGFWDVQVRDAKTLFVHTTFTDQETHRAVVTGYEWTRKPGSEPTTFWQRLGSLPRRLLP